MSKLRQRARDDMAVISQHCRDRAVTAADIKKLQNIARPHNHEQWDMLEEQAIELLEFIRGSTR